jgi:hypothetical protein
MSNKKITHTLLREDPEVEWYNLSEVPKSQAFIDYTDFIKTNLTMFSPQVPFSNSATELTVDIYFPGDKYEEMDALREAALPEMNAYNSANGITSSWTVTDDPE